MVLPGEITDWPDWQDEKTYGYALHLTRRGWAWEFLRRNPEFQRALTCLLEQAEYVERRSDVDVIRSPHDLTQWGLMFRKLLEE